MSDQKAKIRPRAKSGQSAKLHYFEVQCQHNVGDETKPRNSIIATLAYCTNLQLWLWISLFFGLLMDDCTGMVPKACRTISIIHVNMM